MGSAASQDDKDYVGAEQNYVARMDSAAVWRRTDRAASSLAAASRPNQARNHLPHRGNGSDLPGYGLSAARRSGSSSGRSFFGLRNCGRDRGRNSYRLLPQAGRRKAIIHIPRNKCQRFSAELILVDAMYSFAALPFASDNSKHGNSHRIDESDVG